MVTRTQLNSKLKSTFNNQSGLKDLVEKTIKKWKSLVETKAIKVGEFQQGFRVIGDAGQSTLKDTKEIVTGIVTENVKVDLKKISTQKGSISTLTGLSVDNGFLESCVTTVNPKGIKTSLEILAPNKKSQIKAVYTSASTQPDVVQQAAFDDESPEGIGKEFFIQFNQFRNSNGGLKSFLGTSNVKDEIQSSLSSNIKSNDLSNPIIVNSVGAFSNSATPSDYEFTYVNTVEELLLEFRNSERPFSQIIVEFTGEYLDDNFEAKDFQTLYSSQEFTEKGFNGIPYHYLIRKDGRIQRGRPLDIETVYPSGEINYTNSVVVAIPGGYDAPIGTKTKANINSATVSSWKWFNTLLDTAYTMFPGIQVYASPDLKSIGWQAEDYIESLFGKQNNTIQYGIITRENLINVGI